jgi:hypothetical protein
MKFILEIESANAAYDEDTPGEVARLLRHCAAQVEDGVRRGLLRDLTEIIAGRGNLGRKTRTTTRTTTRTNRSGRASAGWPSGR